jgi:hypothetical protein
MSSGYIQDYDFGEIKIDGTTYTNDLIILGTEIIPEWWRKKGHNLIKQDLKKVIEYKPTLLIIGKGYYGRMNVPTELTKELNFTIRSYKTGEAIKKYNKALNKEKRIAGAFHLTC